MSGPEYHPARKPPWLDDWHDCAVIQDHETENEWNERTWGGMAHTEPRTCPTCVDWLYHHPADHTLLTRAEFAERYVKVDWFQAFVFDRFWFPTYMRTWPCI